MEFFAKIVNGFQPLNLFAKISILDVWLGSKYASALYLNITILSRYLKIEKNKSSYFCV